MFSQIGIELPQDVTGDGDGARELAGYIHVAEGLGFTSLWVLDNAGPGVLGPLPVLAFASAVSERALLGVGVLLSSLQSPLRLARDLATLDRLSAGRLVIGVGLGGDRQAYQRHGIAVNDRASHFEAGVVLLRQLLGEESTSWDGPWWKLQDQIQPVAPIQRPTPPLWFGAEKRPALARGVRLGDGWIGAGSATLLEFEGALAYVHDLLREDGRDPETFTVAKRVYVHVGRRTSAVDDELRGWFTRHYGNPHLVTRVVVGPPDLIQQHLVRLRELGTDVLVLHPILDTVDQMHRLASEVLPSVPSAQPR